MVRITKKSRRRRHGDQPFSSGGGRNSSLLLSRHFLHGAIVAMIGLCICLYYFFLSIEKRASSSAGVVSSDPRSAEQILENDLPWLIYGTAWKKERTAELVQQAIKTGFRFIDTAAQPKHYDEKGVGDGIMAAMQELGLERSDVYIQTKFTPPSGQGDHVPYDPNKPLKEQVNHSLTVSLLNLQTDYLDALILHSPMPNFRDTMVVWREFERFVDAGTVVRLGISNCYDYETFTRLYKEARIKPTILQNRFYAESSFDTDLREFCNENDVWYQSFWTLTANREALALPSVHEMAGSKGLTPQTLMYAYLLSMGYARPLDGTTSIEHMQEDIAIMDRIQAGEEIFESDEEMEHFGQILGIPDLEEE